MAKVVASQSWLFKLIAAALLMIAVIVGSLLVHPVPFASIPKSQESSPSLSEKKMEFLQNDHGQSSSIPPDSPFLTVMRNAESNTMTACDPFKYEYFKLLLVDMKSSNLHQNRARTTTADIESDYLSWKRPCWDERRVCFTNICAYTLNSLPINQTLLCESTERKLLLLV